MGLDILKFKVSKDEMDRYIQIRNMLPSYDEEFNISSKLFDSSRDIVAYIKQLGAIKNYYEVGNKFVIEFYNTNSIILSPRTGEYFTIVDLYFDDFVERDLDVLDVMELLNQAGYTDRILHLMLYKYELRINYKSVNWNYSPPDDKLVIGNYLIKRCNGKYLVNGEPYSSDARIIHMIKDRFDFDLYLLYTLMYFFGYRAKG